MRAAYAAFGVPVDAFTISATMRLFCVAGSLDSAAELLGMCQRGEVGVADSSPLYNVLMTMYDQAGQRDKALALHRVMISRGVAPDSATLSTILQLMKKEGRIDAMPAVINAQVAAGNASTSSFNTMIASVLHAGGSVERVHEITTAMQTLGVQQDIVTINILMNMHIDRKEFTLAIATLTRALTEQKLEPAQNTHVAALRAYAGAGDSAAALKHLASIAAETTDARAAQRVLQTLAALLASMTRQGGNGHAADAAAAAEAAVAFGARVFERPRTDRQLRAWVTNNPFYAVSAFADYLFVLQTGAAASPAVRAAVASSHASAAVAFAMSLESKMQLFSSAGTGRSADAAKSSRLYAQALARTALLAKEAGQSSVSDEVVSAMELWFSKSVLEGVFEYAVRLKRK